MIDDENGNTLVATSTKDKAIAAELEGKTKSEKANSNALAFEKPNAPEIPNSQFSILNSYHLSLVCMSSAQR